MAETKTGAQATTDSATPPAGTPAGAPAAAAAGTPAATPAPAADGKPAEGDGTPAPKPEGKADEATPPAKAPEKYDVKVPEAGAKYIDQADLERFQEYAKANDWTNEELQAEIDAAVATTEAKAQRQAAADLSKLQADPDYGGEKLSESQRLVANVINRVRPEGHARRDAFMGIMQSPTVVNNPEVVAFLADLGRMIGEDAPGHPRATAPGSTESAAAKLYDHPDSRALDAGR